MNMSQVSELRMSLLVSTRCPLESIFSFNLMVPGGEPRISQYGFMVASLNGMIRFNCETFPALLNLLFLMISRPFEPSTKIQFSVCASFKISPMLGDGEVLSTVEICVEDLTDNTHCEHFISHTSSKC